MGMFSWCCKGCGHELKMDELVRMNWCKGTYDGYGGNSGGFDSEGGEVEPACWHEACYRKATQEERADKTPSRHAPDQGFGHPALAFLKGYKEEAKTEYRVVVHTTTGTYPDTKQHEFNIVMEGEFVLRDYAAYHEVWDNWDSGEEFPDNFFEMTEEERNARQQRLRERFEAETGLKDPRLNAVSFPSLEHAKKVADTLVSDIPEYDLVILGRQRKVEGMCYERTRNRKYRRTDNGIEPTGEFREVVEYEHGVPAKKGRKGVLERIYSE
jgi:hypothetical protein